MQSSPYRQLAPRIPAMSMQSERLQHDRERRGASSETGASDRSSSCGMTNRKVFADTRRASNLQSTHLNYQGNRVPSMHCCSRTLDVLTIDMCALRRRNAMVQGGNFHLPILMGSQLCTDTRQNRSHSSRYQFTVSP